MFARKMVVFYLIALGLLILSKCSWAEINYTVTDLGAFPCGSRTPWSRASSINNSGQIAGDSVSLDGNQHAFIWECGMMKDLGTLGGSTSVSESINNCGTVVGWSHTTGFSNTHAFLWNNGEQMKDLGTLSGDDKSIFSDVNDAGQVIGTSMNSAERHAYIWDSANGMQRINTFSGDAKSGVTAINNYGQIAGSSTDVDGITRAALWHNIDSGECLPALDNAYYSSATDINDAGVVVGIAMVEPGLWSLCHSFIWDSIGGIKDIGFLQPGDNYCHANAINNHGAIVGYSYDSAKSSSTTHAFLQQDGKMYDLTSFIPTALRSSCTAVDINDAGQVIINSGRHAFLLTPVPEPSSILTLFCGIGGMGGLVWRRKSA